MAFNPYKMQNYWNYSELSALLPTKDAESLWELGIRKYGTEYVIEKAKNPANCIYRIKALILEHNVFSADGCQSEELNRLYHELHSIVSISDRTELKMEQVNTWIELFLRQNFEYGIREGLFWALQLLKMLKFRKFLNEDDISQIMSDLSDSHGFAAFPLGQLRSLKPSSNFFRRRLENYMVLEVAQSTPACTKLLQWRSAVWRRKFMGKEDYIRIGVNSSFWSTLHELDTEVLNNELEQAFASVSDLAEAMTPGRLQAMSRLLNLSLAHLYLFGYMPSRYQYPWPSVFSTPEANPAAVVKAEVPHNSLRDVPRTQKDNLLSLPFPAEIQEIYEDLCLWIFDASEFDEFYRDDLDPQVPTVQET